MSEGNVSSSGDNCRVVWKSLELIQSRRTAPAWQFLTFWRGSSLERVLPFLSFQLCSLGLGQTPSRCLAIFSIGCGLCIYKYVYLFVYICMPERHWVVHILAVLKGTGLSTVLSKSHFYSREKHFKRHWVGHLKGNRLSTFGGHFWPQNVDNPVPFKVANPMPLWKRYVFPYFSLFGPFFLKNQNLNWKANGHIGGQTNAFQKFSMFFFCFFWLLFSYFPFFFFLAPFLWCFWLFF